MSEINPFDFVNSINNKKNNLLEEGSLPEVEKAYNPFLTNRAFSYHGETVLLANLMNKHHHIDNKLQYDFYRMAVPAGKRYSKWYKPEMEGDITTVMEYYGYSRKLAESVTGLLAESEIQQMKQFLSRGGKPKNTK